MCYKQAIQIRSDYEISYGKYSFENSGDGSFRGAWVGAKSHDCHFLYYVVLNPCVVVCSMFWMIFSCIPGF